MAEQDKKNQEKLAGILYISIPEDLQRTIHDLEIDPNKLLPIDTGTDPDSWNIESLSWEMIISGMLKILAFQPEHGDIDYYRRFVKTLKPELLTELTEAGIIKAKNKDFDLAEEIFLALVGLEPSHCRSLLNLALLYEDRASTYEKLGKEKEKDECHEKAFLWFRRALSLDDVIPEAHLYAAYFYLKQYLHEEALREFRNYLQVSDDPDQKARVEEVVNELERQNLKDTQFKEAYDFIRMGKEQEGIERIEGFLKNNPDVWNAWFLLGWARRRLALYEEARQAFSQALSLGGENADSLNELAICEMELERYQESKKHLERALYLEPENSKIISNLGILSLKTGHEREAEAFFLSVLEYEPEDPIALRYLELLQKEE